MFLVGGRDSYSALYVLVAETERKVHAALCENFNTKGAITALDALVNELNTQFEDPRVTPAHLLVQKSGVLITKIYR